MKIIISLLSLILFLPMVLKADLFEKKVIFGTEHFNDEFKMESMNENIKFLVGVGIGKGEKKSRFEGNLLISTDLRKSNGSYYRFYKFTMPILYKYKFKEVNAPYFVVGASASIILAEQTNHYGRPIKGIDNTTYFDYGLLFGAGYEVDFKRSSITFEARYYKGLKEIEFNSFKFKRSGLYLLIGVLFW